MTSKQRPIRVFGQRSISSSPLFRSTNTCKSSSNEDKPRKQSSSVSLSQFLDQKLQQTSVHRGTVQCKARPFSTLVDLNPRNGRDSGDGTNQVKKGVEDEQNNAIKKVVFEQFKLTDKEKEETVVSSGKEAFTDFIAQDEVQEPRKRRNPFAGEENATYKSVVVLGRGAEPRPKRRNYFIKDRKAKPLYNHYANGGGFWDGDMEGVDSEEVGFSEIWEGVGSTTLGGIEWH